MPGSDKAQFHQSDGDRRPHPDHHGFRVQNARHGSDIAQHPADERVHHVERGNIDQYAAGMRAHNAFGQVLLQRHCQAVVHVHLDGDQEELAHLKNRNTLHGRLS